MGTCAQDSSLSWTVIALFLLMLQKRLSTSVTSFMLLMPCQSWPLVSNNRRVSALCPPARSQFWSPQWPVVLHCLLRGFSAFGVSSAHRSCKWVSNYSYAQRGTAYLPDRKLPCGSLPVSWACFLGVCKDFRAQTAQHFSAPCSQSPLGRSWADICSPCQGPGLQGSPQLIVRAAPSGPSSFLN